MPRAAPPLLLLLLLLALAQRRSCLPGPVTAAPPGSDPCLGRPCRNNGTCFPAAPRRLPSAAAYRCVCPPGVTGASCQVRAASAPRPRARPCPWASPRCLRTAPSRPRAAGASLSVPAAGRASGPQPCPRRGRAAGRRGGRLEEPRQRRPRAVAAAQPALSLGRYRSFRGEKNRPRKLRRTLTLRRVSVRWGARRRCSSGGPGCRRVPEPGGEPMASKCRRCLPDTRGRSGVRDNLKSRCHVKAPFLSLALRMKRSSYRAQRFRRTEPSGEKRARAQRAVGPARVRGRGVCVAAAPDGARGAAAVPQRALCAPNGFGVGADN